MRALTTAAIVKDVPLSQIDDKKVLGDVFYAKVLQGKWEEATQAVDRALEIDPNFAPTANKDEIYG